ncbi:hypothetical protein JF66_20565, partial [Cryobacterium sp. MLB-32]|uniref:type ISP restriction/modification enzyme n=1 Tax=Cryobacterium sp. MLB-32 TaxID=1529318 RepID=UPI0004E7BA36
GARVPFTKDPSLFAEVRDVGAELIYAQTFGARAIGHAAHDDFANRQGIAWSQGVTHLPGEFEISYDEETETLNVADGTVSGVRPEVWQFSVSGWPVVQRWLQNRSALGRGHIRSKPKPLDRIRPTHWIDDWNDELLDLLKAIERTVRLSGLQELLLEKVFHSELFDIDEFPVPSRAERMEPKY